jgi:hypothetical protein
MGGAEEKLSKAVRGLGDDEAKRLMPTKVRVLCTSYVEVEFSEVVRVRTSEDVPPSRCASLGPGLMMQSLPKPKMSGGLLGLMKLGSLREGEIGVGRY